jgi:hypothetical protein
MTEHETPDLAAFKEMIVNFGHVCAVHGEPDADLKDGHYIMREVERLNRAARAPLLAEIERLRNIAREAADAATDLQREVLSLRSERDAARAALENIKLKCISLADAQVVAMEALAASPKEKT